LAQSADAIGERLRSDRVAARIVDRDHTLWKPDPEEISNRLGWLDSPRVMANAIDEIGAVVTRARAEGLTHALLLGMGGSSLAPEVFRRVFGVADGHLDLAVLDSTDPAAVAAVTEPLDPARTLFLPATKSGGTVETLSFLKYCYGLTVDAVGRPAAGRHFAAITDPGSGLEEMARALEFGHIFRNDPNIGGRYSALSYFGLVAARLGGVDIGRLLTGAREASADIVDGGIGLRLAAAMAAAVAVHRDKLTLIASSGMQSLGVWIEQLIAESTGKEGKGILPVEGESVGDPGDYGDDRLFVYLRMDGDDNRASDETVQELEASGHPVARLEVRDRYDLGAEFFRWEFATAVAGAIISVNPFDQPNVQAAKDMTDSVLEAYNATGKLTDGDSGNGVQELLDGLTKGDYLAIMPYVSQTPKADRAFEALRRNIVERYGVATTLGYGPRFLHSTGQLHKGGPSSGAFLQITTSHGNDIPIPGAPYSFGTLADAQALGDREALAAAGRRVARLHIDSDIAAGVLELARHVAGK
jgi:glucose-6-phosphate isomerase